MVLHGFQVRGRKTRRVNYRAARLIRCAASASARAVEVARGRQSLKCRKVTEGQHEDGGSLAVDSEREFSRLTLTDVNAPGAVRTKRS